MRYGVFLCRRLATFCHGYLRGVGSHVFFRSAVCLFVRSNSPIEYVCGAFTIRVFASSFRRGASYLFCFFVVCRFVFLSCVSLPIVRRSPLGLSGVERKSTYGGRDFLHGVLTLNRYLFAYVLGDYFSNLFDFRFLAVFLRCFYRLFYQGHPLLV